MRRSSMGATMAGRWILVIAAVAIVAFGLGAAPAGATGPPDLVCGVNPTTSVVLREDLTCDTSFDVGKAGDQPPIVIDLGGHTLTVTTPDAPCLLNEPSVSFAACAIFGETPTVVRNGTVVGSIGLASQPIAGRASHLTVHGDVWLSGAGGFVHNNTIDGGFIRNTGSSAVVRANLINDGGVSFDDSFTGMTVSIEGNVIVHSPADGIQGILGGGGEFQDDVIGDITGNTIDQAVLGGIDLGGALTNFGAFAVSGNRAMGSGFDGITIAGTDHPPTSYVGGPMTVSDNRVGRNLGFGINAPWVSNISDTGVVDGGGNQARQNGSAPACIGVVCTP